MSGLDMEFAILCPDGTLAQEYSHTHIYGQCVSNANGARVFRSRAEAEYVIREMCNAAAVLGIRDPLFTVVTRYCSAWQVPNSPDIAEQFSDYLTRENRERTESCRTAGPQCHRRAARTRRMVVDRVLRPALHAGMPRRGTHAVPRISHGRRRSRNGVPRWRPRPRTRPGAMTDHRPHVPGLECVRCGRAVWTNPVNVRTGLCAWCERHPEPKRPRRQKK